MGGIIDHLQAIVVSNFLNRFNITRIGIAMHRHNGSRACGNSRFNFLRINIECSLVYIDKYGFKTIPHDRVTSCYKGIGGGDHFTTDA
ncbi:hypothetical protein D3C72_1817140 [compost metagenome]